MSQSQQGISIQTMPGIAFTSDMQLQQQQLQQLQQQQQQQQAFFFHQQQQQQQQQLQQFAQPINQQHPSLQQPQQQQVIVSGGQIMSAAPMVTLAMTAGPAGTAIPVHPGMLLTIESAAHYFPIP